MQKRNFSLIASSLIASLSLMHSGLAYAQNAEQPTVLMISLDGFAYEYLERYQPKHLLQLAQNGIVAPLTPVYPTKTFPNHISLATGLYPSEHGIIDNRFYDKTLKANYSMGDGATDSTWITAGIPIWNLAEQQGLTAATYFWPESDARINGMTPSYFYHYSHNAAPEQRVEQIVNWLKLPASTRPKLVMSYFHQVDTAGHVYGPYSQEAKETVAYIDGLIGNLVQRIETETDVNLQLILVADHGMAEIKPEYVMKSRDLPNPAGFVRTLSSTRVVYYRNEDTPDSEVEQLKQDIAALNLESATILSDADRERLGYSHTSRTGDIIVEAIYPASFTPRNQLPTKVTGNHGFKDLAEMDGIFIAYGSGFKQDTQPKALKTIDMYPLVAEILGLSVEHDINGDAEKVLPLLK